jgi:hypothetical protein
LTEADSQGSPAEDTTSERLELAKASFDHVEDHVAALESKARTFLTVNSLLVGAGVLSVARGVSAESGGMAVRIMLALLVFCLLGFVAAAFKSLFAVLDVRRFEGRPRGSSTLDNFAADDARTLRESLARYYADAAEKNRPVAEAMVVDLKRAVVWTRWAFWSFVGTIAILTLFNVLTGEPQMQSKPDTPRESTSGSGSTSGGSQPAPTPQPAQPAPKPVEGVPLPLPHPIGAPALPQPAQPAPKPVEGVPLERGEPPIKSK